MLNCEEIYMTYTQGFIWGGGGGGQVALASIVPPWEIYFIYTMGVNYVAPLTLNFFPTCARFLNEGLIHVVFITEYGIRRAVLAISCTTVYTHSPLQSACNHLAS